MTAGYGRYEVTLGGPGVGAGMRDTVWCGVKIAEIELVHSGDWRNVG